MNQKCQGEFWAKFPELCWSNRKASDAVHIRAALCRPRFECLLEIALNFGLDSIRTEWEFLKLHRDLTPEVDHAAPIVARILKNIELGFKSASS